MIGRRVPDGTSPVDMQAGDYGRFNDELWMLKPPDFLYCHISQKVHQITEHEDGTITVSPSILVRGGADDKSWHGYLERGVWRTV